MSLVEKGTVVGGWVPPKKATPRLVKTPTGLWVPPDTMKNEASAPTREKWAKVLKRIGEEYRRKGWLVQAAVNEDERITIVRWTPTGGYARKLCLAETGKIGPFETAFNYPEGCPPGEALLECIQLGQERIREMES